MLRLHARRLLRRLLVVATVAAVLLVTPPSTAPWTTASAAAAAAVGAAAATAAPTAAHAREWFEDAAHTKNVSDIDQLLRHPIVVFSVSEQHGVAVPNEGDDTGPSATDPGTTVSVASARNDIKEGLGSVRCTVEAFVKRFLDVTVEWLEGLVDTMDDKDAIKFAQDIKELKEAMAAAEEKKELPAAAAKEDS